MCKWFGLLFVFLIEELDKTEKLLNNNPSSMNVTNLLGFLIYISFCWTLGTCDGQNNWRHNGMSACPFLWHSLLHWLEVLSHISLISPPYWYFFLLYSVMHCWKSFTCSWHLRQSLWSAIQNWKERVCHGTSCVINIWLVVLYAIRHSPLHSPTHQVHMPANQIYKRIWGLGAHVETKKLKETINEL